MKRPSRKAQPAPVQPADIQAVLDAVNAVPVIVPPYLTEKARKQIRGAVAVYGAHFEVSFRCQWDEDFQCITDAAPTFYGSVKSTRYVESQFLGGEVFLHTHPAGSPTEPSEGDLDCAAFMAKRHIAFGIVNADATTLRMLTTPEMVSPRELIANEVWRSWQHRFSHDLPLQR